MDTSFRTHASINLRIYYYKFTDLRTDYICEGIILSTKCEMLKFMSAAE